MNIQDWFPSGWTGWISLQAEGLSRVFPNITVQKNQFSNTQLSSQSNSPQCSWQQNKFYISSWDYNFKQILKLQVFFLINSPVMSCRASFYRSVYPFADLIEWFGIECRNHDYLQHTPKFILETGFIQSWIGLHLKANCWFSHQQHSSASNCDL